ncbi:hypothetical protein C8R47DRAFT_318097 [Mycena vitilis]|nr:hypothetical protein C8R47DRAFT_318097 [Mycena vitilis]
MMRRATFVALLATFTILCRGAPLHNDRRDAGASSATSSTPLLSASTSVTSTNPTTSSTLGSHTQNTVTSTASSASSSSSSSPSRGGHNAASTPILAPVANWTAFANGTRGYALHQLLTQGISQDAPQRWVTANGIASTDIGGSDPGLSNEALNKAVDTVFGNGSNHRTWVETYCQFLIETWNSTSTASEISDMISNLTDAQTAYATEQARLVRAYVAAHPGNVTYVGVNVANVTRVNGTDMGLMQDWARWGGDANCTSSAGGNLASRTAGNSTLNTLNTTTTLNATSSSSGNSTSSDNGNCTLSSDVGFYTADDYNNKYLTAASRYETVSQANVTSGLTLQIAMKGYQLKHLFLNSAEEQFGIFNLSMDTGPAGAYTNFVPAWSATVVGWGAKNSTSYQTLESDLKAGFNDSTTNSTGIPGMGVLGTRAEPRRRRSSGGFGALQFVAQGLKPAQSDSTSVPISGVAAAGAPAVASSSGDPLEQPLPDNKVLMLLSLQEGTWADGRAEFIKFIRYNKETNTLATTNVIDKYFGPGTSGSGPIGRHWTHLVLIVTTDSPQVSAELFGMVYEVVPGL